jgi:hypothetical protein
MRIHDLRHSFVSNQLDAGTPINLVRDLAGHASIATTQLYAHSSDEARRAPMDRVQVPAPLGPIPDPPKRPRDTKRDNKKKPANAKSAGPLVGHPGLEPGANGLRMRTNRPHPSETVRLRGTSGARLQRIRHVMPFQTRFVPFRGAR